MIHYILINTFEAGKRGRQSNIGPSRDLGSVLSSHRSFEAAEKAAKKLNRAVKRGHGRNAYIPTMIRESEYRFHPGTMVCEGDFDIGDKDYG